MEEVDGWLHRMRLRRELIDELRGDGDGDADGWVEVASNTHAQMDIYKLGLLFRKERYC